MEQQYTINCGGKIIDLSFPIIMGILNVTPDSFYDGGKYDSESAILLQVEKMINEGATIIDIGGMSSRPGAEIITEETELNRVLPIIRTVKEYFPKVILSIDTVHASVARKAIEAGAKIINDISAGKIDSQMYPTVAALQVPYVLMHMKGQPKNMQQNTNYEEVVKKVLDFSIIEIGKLRELGIKDIIIDPGFGFGKTIDQNYEILKKLAVFQILKVPILAGLSRKSMIYKYLETTSARALNGTSILNFVALQQGAKILRVHDVKEAAETIQLWQKISE